MSICKPSNRRQFIGRAAGGAVALASAMIAKAGTVNPFAYDLSRLEKTDPKLVAYEEVRRFRSPHRDASRISIGSQDAISVAAGRYVTMIGSDGSARLEIGLSGEARSVAVSKDGQIFAGLRDHVEVFGGDGKRLAVWETAGKRAWLTGLAVDDKELFAADAGNRVILRFDRSGKLMGRIGEKNKDRNVPGFIIPSPYFCVRLHRDGLLRVNNPGRHRVEVYTRDGDFEGSWGKPSGSVTGFCGCCNPVSLALLADGRYVTCEKGLPRVKVYSAEGEFESVVAGVESFPEAAKAGAGQSALDAGLAGLDAAADSAGQIYILDAVTGDIRVMKRKASPRAQVESGARGC